VGDDPGYIIPAGVSLYGLSCLAAGDVDGFASRSLRGGAGGCWALVLLAALPLAIRRRAAPARPFPRKRDLTGDIRTRDHPRRARTQPGVQFVAEANQPVARGTADPRPVPRAAQRVQRRGRPPQGRLDSRVGELKAEQDRLRRSPGREERRRERPAAQRTVDRHHGFLIVRTLASVFGRREEPKEEPPGAGNAPPGRAARRVTHWCGQRRVTSSRTGT